MTENHPHPTICILPIAIRAGEVTGTNFDDTPRFEGVGLIGYDNGRKQVQVFLS